MTILEEFLLLQSNWRKGTATYDEGGKYLRHICQLLVRADLKGGRRGQWLSDSSIWWGQDVSDEPIRSADKLQVRIMKDLGIMSTREEEPTGQVTGVYAEDDVFFSFLIEDVFERYRCS